MLFSILLVVIYASPMPESKADLRKAAKAAQANPTAVPGVANTAQNPVPSLVALPAESTVPSTAAVSSGPIAVPVAGAIPSTVTVPPSPVTAAVPALAAPTTQRQRQAAQRLAQAQKQAAKAAAGN